MKTVILIAMVMLVVAAPVQAAQLQALTLLGPQVTCNLHNTGASWNLAQLQQLSRYPLPHPLAIVKSMFYMVGTASPGNADFGVYIDPDGAYTAMWNLNTGAQDGPYDQMIPLGQMVIHGSMTLVDVVRNFDAAPVMLTDAGYLVLDYNCDGGGFTNMAVTLYYVRP